MRDRQGRCLVFILILGLFGVGEVLAQTTGTLSGRVRSGDGAVPVRGANVEVVHGSLRSATAVTDDLGRFRISLAPGSYAVVVSMIGYETTRRSDVRVDAGSTTEVEVSLTSRALQLDPVVVSASKRPEKALEAPARVEVVSRAAIAERPTTTPVDHVRSLPGVDVFSTGLVQTNVVTRGFNNIFSGALMVVTDNRYSSVPSLRFNAPYMIPANNDDIERIEVLLGPASALYGPNSANGVMHLITRSPIESQGSSVSVSGGERSVLQLSGRHASAFGENVGVKISGQFMQGDDWEHSEPSESFARDFSLRTMALDARVDYRFRGDAEAILSAGTSNVGRALELTGLGAAQVRDWRYSYYQGRFRSGRLFMQAFTNHSDAGETFLLDTGNPIVDRSWIGVAQAQHGRTLGERQDFTYGIDFQRTQPRTEGTILGRNEGVTVNEIGGYVQSRTRLGSRVDALVAGRVDSHDYINETVFSPRAALIVRPSPAQNVRLTYNRAFDTPTSNNLFLDLEVSNLIPGVMSVRAAGVPADGFAFRRDCAGGIGNLCMRSGFAPQAGFIPANAVPLWKAAVELAIMMGAPESLEMVPAPGPGVGTDLRVLNTTTRLFDTAIPSDVLDVDPMRPTITNTLEVGYSGILGDRLLLAADVYRTRKNDFIGPLMVETLAVFFDRATLAAHLAQYMSAGDAGALAAVIAGIPGDAMTGIPLGSVVPDSDLTASGDLFVTYRNFGELTYWGSDLAAQYILTDHWSARLAYSLVSRDLFPREEVGGLSDVALNAPRNKGSASALYRNPVNGMNGEIRVRYAAAFPMNSGIYIGDVDAMTMLDASMGYRLPFARGRAGLSVSAQNLLDRRHRFAVGAPEIGRMVLARLQYSF
jgi:outer membrane receptor for ferrienterochelin and colicins